MKFPLRSTVQIGKYVAGQQRKGERYPLVLMLEPPTWPYRVGLLSRGRALTNRLIASRTGRWAPAKNQ